MASEHTILPDSLKPDSPLTSGPCELLETIPVDHITKLYKKEFGFDVTPYLQTDAVRIFRCVETGYEFYAPHSIAGPPEFYADLYGASENDNWAFQAIKWEYEAAMEFIPNGARLLDIGCGGGDFLSFLGTKCDSSGLETNSYSLESARTRGLVAVDETIEEHAQSHAGAYDVVTAFQVLEHVADVRSFVASSLAALAPGGLLIIAVPNNDSFISAETDLTLNLPPHHVGLWRRKVWRLSHRFLILMWFPWKQNLCSLII